LDYHLHVGRAAPPGSYPDATALLENQQTSARLNFPAVSFSGLGSTSGSRKGAGAERFTNQNQPEPPSKTNHNHLKTDFPRDALVTPDARLTAATLPVVFL
jgi:hypothetical protein